MTSRTGGRVIAVTAAVLLAGSIAYFVVTRVTPPMNTGPLGNGGTAGGICVPLAPGQPLSWGITYLGNTGGSDAVIEKVDLVNAKDARLAATYVVPITGLNEYGGLAGPFAVGAAGEPLAARAAVPPPRMTTAAAADAAMVRMRVVAFRDE